MEKWIKNISDQDIEEGLMNTPAWKEVPAEIDEKTERIILELSAKQEKKTFFLPRNVIFAGAALGAIVLLLALFVNINRILPAFRQMAEGNKTTNEKTMSSVTFFTDDIAAIRNGKRTSLGLQATIETGDRIITGRNSFSSESTDIATQPENDKSPQRDYFSFCDLLLGDHSIVNIGEKTECIFSLLSDKETKIELMTGRIVARVEKKAPGSLFAITTDNITITVHGTIFMVERSPDATTMVSVYRGEVNIDYPGADKMKHEIVGEGDSFSINKGKSEKSKLSDPVKAYLQKLVKKKVKNLDSSVKTILSVKPETVSVTIDNMDAFTIKEKAGLLLEPGKHVIEFGKTGFKPQKITIDPKAGEEFTKNIILEQDEQLAREWTWRKIYTYKNTENSALNGILGFSGNSDYAVAYTQESIFCINGNGELVWEKRYGESVKTLFDSPPIVSGNKVYASSLNKQVIVLDGKTGKELERKDTRGSINYNYTMVRNKNAIYIPFPDGIYAFDETGNTLSPNPLFPFNSPTTPVLFENGIFVSSFLSREVVRFDGNGKREWTFMTDDRGYSSLLLADKNLFVGDKSGIVYSLSLKGELRKKISLPGGITSNLVRSGDNLLCLADNGTLYQMRIDDLSITASYPVDSTPDVSGYIRKFPLVQSNTAFIGSEKGTLLIIDLVHNRIEKELPISVSPVSCAVHPLRDFYLMATEDGEIFLIERK
jgi:outer membrane protein assembly factor BamB